MLFKYLTVAASIIGLPLLSTAAPGTVKARDTTCYCPSTGEISHADRVALFNAFNALIFAAANDNNADDVATAFATYVSPNLIEHTGSASSYGADVGFLSTLLPGVTVRPIGGLSGCFHNTYGQPICTIHYAAFPEAGSILPNVTAISDYYRYDGSCIVEHWDSTYLATASTTNPNFPGPA